MSPSMHARALVLAALVTTMACASTHTPHQSRARWVSDKGVLTETEIAHEGARTAYETIEHLRPQYLSLGRMYGASANRAVYVDGIRFGGLEVLQGIQSTTIREIQWLDSRDATIRFGTGNPAGAILIFTKGTR